MVVEKDVVIAHELKLISESLKAVIEKKRGVNHIEMVNTGKELMRKINTQKDFSIDLAFVDINLPDLGGFQAVELIRQKFKDAKIILLSLGTNPYSHKELEAAGVSDFLTFEEDRKFLFRTIDRVLKPKPNLRNLEFAVAHNSKKTSRPKPADSSFLTKKEKEVLRALTMECDNQKVGNILGIKPTTVMTHKKHLIKKLGVKSTAELVIYSFKNLVLQDNYTF